MNTTLQYKKRINLA